MMRAVLYNPIGMTDRDICEVYWTEKQNHDLRTAFINLLLNA